MSSKFSHGYALLIGVGECANSDWSLPVTVKDMQALRSVLTDPLMCGYHDDSAHIKLLHDHDATKQAILDGLGWLAEQTSADDEATAIVFYSGHGGLDQNTGSYFLLPHETDPSNIASSVLFAEAFTEALRSVTAKRLLVFFDCCHAAGMATSKDGIFLNLPSGYFQGAMPKGLVEELKQGEGRAVFSSSTNLQKSWIMRNGQLSIYTYHLIEALYGAGNRPGDTVVRLSNLMNHLGASVQQSARKAWNREQTPFFDATTEDFPVALLCGGKGLSSGGFMPTEAARRIGNLLPGISTGGSAQTAGLCQTLAHSFENPFGPLNGRITDLQKVFDRKREVKDALEFLKAGSSIVFLGNDGVGRSTLLTLLMDRVSDELGWDTIYLDMQMVLDEDGFYDELCKRLGVASARGYRLVRALKSRGRHILLALDEVDKMSWDGFTRNMRSELRGLTDVDDAPLKLALAARTPLDRLFPDSEGDTSPLAGICMQIEVRPWDPDHAEGFLLERLKETSVAFSASEMKQLLQDSRGMPKLLMYLAFNLYRQKQRQEL